MAKTYDAVIVGGGHNGLVAAAYLAKAGRRVLVLEQRHVLGGAAVSEEIYPGFTFSVFSYVVSLFRPHIIRELELTRHGMEIIPLECSFLPLPDGDSLCRENAEVFAHSGAQDFAYGIGTIEIRDKPIPGSAVKWLPNLLWVVAFVGLFITAWYAAKLFEVI